MSLQLKKTCVLGNRSRAYLPLEREGTLVVSDTDGVLHCYDVLTGEELAVSGKRREEGCMASTSDAHLLMSSSKTNLSMAVSCVRWLATLPSWWCQEAPV